MRQVCGVEEGNALFQTNDQFLEKQEELLAPLRERYEKIHAEIS